MAEQGIARPEEFEYVFERMKQYGLIDKFTELVCFAAFVGFSRDRNGDGPFHRPVEWKSFDAEERHRIYMLGVAHTRAKGGGKADPTLISMERRRDLFRIIERYVHGGLLEMNDAGVFRRPDEEAYREGLATFVRTELREERGSEPLDLQDVLRDLQAFGAEGS